MKPITSNQVEQWKRFLTDAVGPCVETALRQMDEDGHIGREGFQEVIGRPDLPQRLIPLLKEMVFDMSGSKGAFLRELTMRSLNIGPTDGRETIRRRRGLFLHGIGRFENLDDLDGSPTAEIGVRVYEIFRRGNMSQFLGNLSANPELLCMEQSQVIMFVERYSKWLKYDWGTLFPVWVGKNPQDKPASREMRIAFINRFSDGSLEADLLRFLDSDRYDGVFRMRLVVPDVRPEIQTLKWYNRVPGP